MGAKANRAYVASVEEVTWGVTPATPTLDKINFTDDSLNYEIESTTPDTIRDDRMVSDVILTSAGSTGGYEFEFQAIASGPDDEHLLAALWAEDWLGDDTEIDATGCIITASSRTLDLTPVVAVLTPLVIGQKLIIAGSAQGNDGVYTVESITSVDVYVVVEAFTGDETFVSGQIWGTKYIRNGVFQHSFTLERGHADVSEYFLFTGMVVNEFSLNFQAGEVVTGGYTFVGKDTVVTQTPNGTVYNDAPTTPIMSAGFNVKNVKLNNLAIEDCLLMSLELNINNNVEGKLAVGNFGFCSTAEGEFEVSGAISLYFNDSTMYQRFITNEAFSLSFELSDGDNVYIFTMPRMKLSTDVVNVEGKNTDVMDNAEYFAIIDPTTNCMLQIDRILAP